MTKKDWNEKKSNMLWTKEERNERQIPHQKEQKTQKLEQVHFFKKEKKTFTNFKSDIGENFTTKPPNVS